MSVENTRNITTDIMKFSRNDCNKSINRGRKKNTTKKTICDEYTNQTSKERNRKPFRQQIAEGIFLKSPLFQNNDN